MTDAPTTPLTCTEAEDTDLDFYSKVKKLFRKDKRSIKYEEKLQTIVGLLQNSECPGKHCVVSSVLYAPFTEKTLLQEQYC